ncbi:hypothetical protein [Roseovarius rhodophyticola]|uniref:Uncharacterized protein n=1 Tax=Roseovarius rhodophyticola TaxID=3080827 RepID=A0ABZ2TJA4_9RHOB|nr:hypothetical protein [Roseovarius sp. W115]MDV2928097.1 hypothetical protein [Roseovarius sp. W115]
MSLYYKEGVEVTRVDSDLARCGVFALREVPKDIRRRYIPPVYDYRRYCSGSGNCTIQRVLIRPGRWESYDANEELRSTVQAQCMADRGYAKVRLKACSPSVIEQTRITSTRVLPPLTANSCAIRIKGDKYQIVTP